MTNTDKRAIQHYFEYSSAGIEVIEDGLVEIPFGEYLIEQNALTRFQLLRALQLQDKHPGVRLGECVAALGYMRYNEIEYLLNSWEDVSCIEVQ